MRLSAAPTWPTSVPGLASGTRSGIVTWPLLSGSSVTLVAVAATRRSGRSDTRTQAVPISPVRTRAAANTAISASATSCSVLGPWRQRHPADDGPVRA